MIIRKKLFNVTLLATAVLVSNALFAKLSEAGPLGPGKASDVVTLIATGLGLGCPLGVSRPFDKEVTPDGLKVNFSIPPGKVLVLTGFEWFKSPGCTNSVDCGKRLTYQLVAINATQNAIFSLASDNNPSLVNANALLPNIVVRDTGSNFLCVFGFLGNTPVLPGVALLHGFLAPDK